MSLLAPTCQLFVLLLHCTLVPCLSASRRRTFIIIITSLSPDGVDSCHFSILLLNMARFQSFRLDSGGCCLLPPCCCCSIHTIYNTTIRFRAKVSYTFSNCAPRLDRDEMVVLLLHYTNLLLFLVFSSFSFSFFFSFEKFECKVQSNRLSTCIRECTDMSPLLFYQSLFYLFCLLWLLPLGRARERSDCREDRRRKTASVEKSGLIACACWLRSVIAAERMLGGSYNQTFITRENDSQRDDATTSTTIVTQRRG
jgi:hypothetical protein